MIDGLYKKLRSREILHRAWATVRESALSSPSEVTVKAIKNYDEKWLSNLEQVAKQLRAGTFSFDAEQGVAIPKGKGKGHRPIVMAPVNNRVVRRAILEVLQGFGSEGSSPQQRGWSGVPAVKQVMGTRTSVGGIRECGVPHGLALVDEAVRDGKSWFVRSDIKEFFTRIPLEQVNSFIADAISDEQFVRIFKDALKTNLANRSLLEERRQFKLFPSEDIGVAQGSALSALAANIVLQQFDAKMNERGIVCVRYIDDFILLGATEIKVQKAYAAARDFLKSMGMDVYDRTDTAARKAGKFDEGNIHNGTDILGYRVSGFSRQPSSAAEQSFRKRCRDVVQHAKKQMALAASGQQGQGYHQSMVLLHKTARGWSQAFRHTTATQTFASLDREIDRWIRELRAFATELTREKSDEVRRRVMGVQLLADIPPHPLPIVPHPVQAADPHRDGKLTKRRFGRREQVALLSPPSL
ncbi:reverse transcriptase domain-containing protein [Bradyrhizobium oligotrophicum S58]